VDSYDGVKPDTERMFEFQNTGPGAVITEKTKKFRRQLNAFEAKKYTLENIFAEFKGKKDIWDPRK